MEYLKTGVLLILFGLEPLLILTSLCTSVTSASQPCAAKHFGDSVVCVCNSTYCDTVPPVPKLSPGMFAVYTSSQAGDRFQLTTGKVRDSRSSASCDLVYELRMNNTRQSIIGFGGAFTDAAGINIASLPLAVQDKLLESYFTSEGLEYNFGRIPMASCDFSTHAYSYDDVDGDLELSHFALAMEDNKFKIPYIQQALKLTNNKLRLFASPWSAPAWMKTNKNMKGNGTLIGHPGGQYYKTWANYFVRFLQEYSKHNISLWGVTTENEPTAGFVPNYGFQCMGFTAEMQRDFVKMDLGPAMHKNGFQNVKIMIMDDQRNSLPHWPSVVLKDPEAAKYVSGIAVHWYGDRTPLSVLDTTHDLFPDYFLQYTEACNGAGASPHVALGDWGRGERYATDIIDNLNHWVTGWTDWNIALDLEGGPNWVKNFVDSPIIVNASSAEFYKQPMFYILGHFSKFLVPGSKYMDLIPLGFKLTLYHVAFVRPDGSIAVILCNIAESPAKLSLHDPAVGYIDLTVPAKSIQTVLWTS
ncbi:lysosomal acid glucosylceramidase-like [Littorina saxatilis]|uniref:Glucosylceramidase n=1 Tax=Littorina saxatilis TaxID=31220 RepID=A0AAN9C003_9CAEN